MLRVEPLLNYRFSLTVSGFISDVDCGFMEVSGFSSKLNGEKYKEGGTNTYDIFLPTGIGAPINLITLLSGNLFLIKSSKISN